MQRFVSYIRVSTRKQEGSGLGLEAQRESARRHITGCSGVLVKEYQEIESRTKCDRPVLLEALKHCRMAGATLLIARFDRLAGNVHFVSGLLEAGIDFVACDNPTANRFTIHILAAVAEKEVSDIRLRTKAALAALKDRGVPLGTNARNRDGVLIGQLIPRETTLKNLAAAWAENTRSARAAYADYQPILREMQDKKKTRRCMAEELNAAGYLTRTGKPWNHVQVGRILSSMETSQ